MFSLLIRTSWTFFSPIQTVSFKCFDHYFSLTFMTIHLLIKSLRYEAHFWLSWWMLQCGSLGLEKKSVCLSLACSCFLFLALAMIYTPFSPTAALSSILFIYFSLFLLLSFTILSIKLKLVCHRQGWIISFIAWGSRHRLFHSCRLSAEDTWLQPGCWYRQLSRSLQHTL